MFSNQTFKLVEIDEPLAYYGDYPYKGYKAEESQEKRLTRYRTKRPSLNPRVIWKHLRDYY